MLQEDEDEQVLQRLIMHGAACHDTSVARPERANSRPVGVSSKELRATALPLQSVQARGRLRAQVAWLERAVQLLSAAAATPLALGAVRLSLSQALWQAGGDPVRTMTLARLARDELAVGGPAVQARHDEAQAWIRCLCLDVRERLVCVRPP